MKNFESRLKRVTELFEKINSKNFYSIMIDERKPEITNLSIGEEEFILEKDIDPMEFIKEYQLKNNIIFNKSNSLTVIIRNYRGKRAANPNDYKLGI